MSKIVNLLKNNSFVVGLIVIILLCVYVCSCMYYVIDDAVYSTTDEQATSVFGCYLVVISIPLLLLCVIVNVMMVYFNRCNI